MTTKLQLQVIEFMREVAHQRVEPVPTIPDVGTVRLRVMLVIEEALEFLEACFGQVPEKLLIEEMIRNTINAREMRVNLEEVADALGDLDYVSEGSRLAFGIEGGSVADEIHRTNMLKVGGEVREGKTLKPRQWEKPKIEEILAKQNVGDILTVGEILNSLERNHEI